MLQFVHSEDQGLRVKKKKGQNTKCPFQLRNRYVIVLAGICFKKIWNTENFRTEIEPVQYK